MENQENVGDSGEFNAKAPIDCLRPRRYYFHFNENGIPFNNQNGTQQREKWTKNIEFLLSCVALSFGFGNMWRFPYIAYKNGGGAFVIPYLIVMFIIGRPIYYLEMVLGQFSNRDCVKVYDLAPAMRGIGVGQTIANLTAMTYYASVLAITLWYLVASFSSELPWSQCDSNWTNCIDSALQGNFSLNTNIQGVEAIQKKYQSGTRHMAFSANVFKLKINNDTAMVDHTHYSVLSISNSVNNHERPVIQPKTSAELYFTTIINSVASLDNGLGYPDWKLTISLIVSWMCIIAILIKVKGIRSFGKVSYLLAICPNIIIAILLVRSVTLEGAWTGIAYFFKPQWDKLLTIEVWYEAVTQCFFSLTIGFGGLIVHSSLNNFSNNIYRHSLIITTQNTVASLMAGCIFFGVIGHVAYVTGQEDITKVILAGPHLTFITYSYTIAKFGFSPQLFSVMLFTMFFLLGSWMLIGNVDSAITIIHDQRPEMSRGKIVVVFGLALLAIGLIYIIPTGYYNLYLMDNCVALVTLTLAGFELLTFAWIYGVNRVCKDIEFMLGIKTGKFWRICWAFVAPFTVFFMVAFHLNSEDSHATPGLKGFFLFWYAFAVLQLPYWAIHTFVKKYGHMLREVLQPMASWGPKDKTKNTEYAEIIEEFKQQNSYQTTSFIDKIFK